MKDNGKDEEKSVLGPFSKTLLAVAGLITAIATIITAVSTLPRPNIFFPAAGTATEPPQIQTVPDTKTPKASSPIDWIVDPSGVCRDDNGNYPRWSEYNWSLQQCQEACQNNPTCQGFAMSKQGNYCQILGPDEHNDGTGPNVQITRGDSSQPQYSCYLKAADPSILNWTMDSTGVCRDDSGGYPRWSEYNWSLQQCQEACQNNPTCQGFAMSKQGNYCQILGPNEHNDGTGPNVQITRGDSSQPEYTCFIKH